MSDDVVILDLPAEAPDFVFRPDLSDADLAPVAQGDRLIFALDGADPVQMQGAKLYQRAEWAETAASDDHNTDDATQWYAWRMYIDPVTDNPSGGAKLHLAQFHQRDGADGAATQPALMVNLTAEGDLVAQFETSVGKRAHVLVDGGFDGQAAKGRWLDVLVGADWSQTDGMTRIYLRPEGEADYHLAMLDHGPNTSTGHVFFKFGAYRSFLERDPFLDQSQVRVAFEDVRRMEDPDAIWPDAGSASAVGWLGDALSAAPLGSPVGPGPGSDWDEQAFFHSDGFLWSDLG